MRRKLLFIFVGFGILAQALVPAWMLLKHHLILTRGEKVTLEVTLYDPRDLFMGHYVQLSTTGELPKVLQDVPHNYLRYYCDQRYAQALDRGVLTGKAELDVRVWRGSALAESLRIDGQPAYTYAATHNGLSDVVQADPVDEILPMIDDTLCVEGDTSHIPTQGRFVVLGKHLTWDATNVDEGFFFQNNHDNTYYPCEILETFTPNIAYLIRPKDPLPSNIPVSITFRHTHHGTLQHRRDWKSYRTATLPPTKELQNE